MARDITMVLGMARSGVAAALALAETGAKVRISDLKPRERLGVELNELDGLKNVEWRLGEKAEDAFDGVERLVVSPGVPCDAPPLNVARERGIEVIGEIELAYRLCPAKLYAITGTNGKTTTTTLMGEILKNAGRNTYVVGNIGDPYAGAALKAKADDVVVCEVSSFQLETIDKFRPAVSAILNLTPDHLNRHGTMARYAALKERIFENQRGEDVAVLNYDDPAVREMAARVKCRVVWFSRKEIPPEGAFLVDETIVYGTASDFRSVCQIAEVKIPGAHNLENALAATAMAMCLGDVPAPVVRLALCTFEGVEHRIEFVRDVGGVRFINDSKGTNADSTIKAIEAMKGDTVLILGGSEKNVDFKELCELIAGSPRVKSAVLIGQTAPQFERQLREAGFTRFSHAGYDFEKAVNMAYRQAQLGGTVLLSPACASFDMFEDYEQRGRVFKEIVGRLEAI